MVKKFTDFPDLGVIAEGYKLVGTFNNENIQADFSTGVQDVSGHYFLEWSSPSSLSVNHIKLISSISGEKAQISAEGPDSNIGLEFTAKGDEDIDLSTSPLGNINLKSDIVYVNQSIAKSDDIENRIEFGPGTMSFIENNVAVFDITDSGLKLASGVRVDNISNLAVDVLTTSILTAAATQEKIDNAIEASNVLAENNFFVGDAFNVAQATSAQGSLNILAGGVTDGQYLGGNGTNVILKQILSTEVQNQHVTVTTATQALAANTSYASNYVGLCVMSLPTTNCPAGSIIIVKAGVSGATFQITQAAGQSIRYGSKDGVPVVTTVGVTGYVQSVAPYTNIVLQCTSDNTTFDVLSCVPYVNMEVP